MYLRDILKVVKAQPFTAETDLNLEVSSGFASDLMSDVLRYDGTKGLLVTGLANPQIVRTAEVADIAAILLVRGKVPQPETVTLAQEIGIPIIGTELVMFETCGRLYAAGLPSCGKRNGQRSSEDLG
jgi:predicted transcriptional regulator